MTSGTIFNIQRFSTEDGPGVRTTVFFKGCPLRCVWCSNPESQRSALQVGHRDSLCVGCGSCVEACPNGAVRVLKKGRGFQVKINRRKCTSCGKCVEACAYEAMRFYGRIMTVDEVFEEVKKDIGYYKESGGGVTASGGEALSQAEFVAEFFQRCRRLGIHTTLDTSGYGTKEACRLVCSEVDLVLFDIKIMDRNEHRRFTGRYNDVILRNLEWMVSAGVCVRARVPVVPGITDSVENIAALAEYVAGLDADIPVDFLPYHRYGEGKYEMLDMKYKLGDIRPPSQEHLEKIIEIVKGYGVECSVQ